MDADEKRALCNCRTFILDELHDVHRILDDFIEAGLISPDDAEEITVQPTKLRRKQSLLNSMPQWGESAFFVFLKALARNHHPHILTKLREEFENIQASEPHLSLNEYEHSDGSVKFEAPSWLTEHVAQMAVSERALHLLAQELPPSQLFTLGSVLGFSNARLQHFQAANPHAPSIQMSSMLCDWKANQSMQATVGQLVNALNRAKVHEDVYRNILLDDLGITSRYQNHIHRMETMSACSSGKSEQWV